MLVYSLDYFSPLGLAQSIILQFTPFTCTAHIPSLYKALYCTLFHTHQYTDYSVFLFHFILLIQYQSHFSDFLVPVDISGVLRLPSPSSNSHCQKRVTAVTPTVPTTLGSHCFAHPTAKAKAQSDRIANPGQNPTKNNQKPHHTRLHVSAEVSASRVRAPRVICISHAPYALGHTAARARTHLLCFTYYHISPRVTSHCHISRQPSC